MDVKEVKKFLAENPEDEKIILKEYSEKIITEYKASKEYKDELQREGDRRVTGALEKFQKETMPKHVEEEIKKRFPDETPEQKALRELKLELESIKNEKRTEALKNKKIKALDDRKIPLSLADFLAINNEDTIETDVDNFNKVFSEAITNGVNQRLKSSGIQGEPKKSVDGPKAKLTREDLKNMKPEEILKADAEGRIEYGQ